MPNRNFFRPMLCALLAALPAAAGAFGADGHRIAGLLAAPLLCEGAQREITALVGTRSLEDLGFWADTVRDDPAWRHSAPWHYINIPDGASVRDVEHPPEGDVLWAIDNFVRVLGDGSQPAAARAVALQFVVHFVVDVHQPLHVGRVEDRGGNTVQVRYGRTASDLHAFWDTGVLTRRALSAERYARRLEPLLVSLPREPSDTVPAVWAEESLALRPLVYGFDAVTGELDRRYLEAAEATADRRLAQAAVRLAATLNGVFCGAAQ